MTEPFIQQVRAKYGDNVAQSSTSFNDGHLGGCGVEGDVATHYPIMWNYLVQLLGIKKIIDVGCGFGYSLNFFKNTLKTEEGADIDGYIKRVNNGKSNSEEDIAIEEIVEREGSVKAKPKVVPVTQHKEAV